MSSRLILVTGIRPDYIRTSCIIKKFKERSDVDLRIILTGQHYDKQLKSIFFEEMNLPPPDVVLDSKGNTYAEQHSKLIMQLEKPLKSIAPDACVFLGDANAVIGCITPLKMGIPIVHIEAGQRSFDFSMPEERNRVIIDRVSDVLYCYHENYKINLIREGINPSRCVVTGNTIVDVLDAYERQIDSRIPEVLRKFDLTERKFALLTMHRDGHMRNAEATKRIMWEIADWSKQRGIKVLWPTMPRASKILSESKLPDNFVFTEPLGFFDFVALEKIAAIEFTDSGTNQEVSSIVGTPCVVLRSCTERPETFESNISIMGEFNIGRLANSVINNSKRPGYNLGEGRSAEIIVDDLVKRLPKLNKKHVSDKYIDPFIGRHLGESYD